MRIAVIPGDGIGKEVTAEAVKVLERRQSSFQQAARARAPALGRRLLPRDRRHDAAGRLRPCCAGSTRSSSVRWAIRACPTTATRATSCSARASSSISTSTTARSRCSTSGSVRSRAARPEDVNFVVFRENTEGLYVGVGGRFKAGTEDEVAIQEEINTWKGVHRIIRHAFEFAKARGLTKVCMADKSNAMQQGHALWQRVFNEVGAALSRDRGDALLHRRAGDVHGARPRAVRGDRHQQPVRRHHHRPRRQPAGRPRIRRLRAICIPGGRRCSSRSTDRRRRFAGRNVANPIGAISSVALMLETLGLVDEARAVDAAVRAAINAGDCTADAGGTLGTREAGDAIVSRLTVHRVHEVHRVLSVVRSSGVLGAPRSKPGQPMDREP